MEILKSYFCIKEENTIFFGIDVPGYASLMVVLLFLGGMQLITLGVIGEYIGRVYEEVKGRPLYFVRSSYGLSLMSSDRGKIIESIAANAPSHSEKTP